MVEVISDTSFLIHLATHRITNISDLETEIGSLSFVVPDIVKKELEHLAEDPDKNIAVMQTLDFIKDFTDFLKDFIHFLKDIIYFLNDLIDFL